MTWRRLKTNHDPKHHKEWVARNYRIVWRDQAFGIEMPACYKALVQDGRGWIFVDFKRKRHYKTLKAAKRACEEHYAKRTSTS